MTRYWILLLLLLTAVPGTGAAAWFQPAVLPQRGAAWNPQQAVQEDSMPRRPRFSFLMPKKRVPDEPIQEDGIGWGIAAIILGGIAIISAFSVSTTAAVVLGLGALLLGSVGLNRRRRYQGVAIIGVLLGTAGLVLGFMRGGIPFF